MKTWARQMKTLVKLSLLELWRRNDVWGLLIFAVVLMVPLALMTPFGAAGANRYAEEVALLLIWGFSLFISLGTGARLFPPEFESRTVFPLLSKPIPRSRVLIGKYVGAVTASLSALALFYLLFALATSFKAGVLLHLPADFCQAFVLHVGFVLLATALSLCGSLLVTPSANLSICALVLIGMFFCGRELPEQTAVASGALKGLMKTLYWVFPHVELFDMRQRVIHGWGAVSWSVVALALGYALAYAGALLAVASLLLKRKRV